MSTAQGQTEKIGIQTRCLSLLAQDNGQGDLIIEMHKQCSSTQQNKGGALVYVSHLFLGPSYVLLQNLNLDVVRPNPAH